MRTCILVCRNCQASDILNTELDVKRIFHPVDAAWQAVTCRKLELHVVKPHAEGNKPRHLREPLQIRPIVRDGNCWFRSISVAVTGGEEDYLAIRKAIVDFMYVPTRDLQMRKEHRYTSTTEYIIASSMARRGIWGTECEIVVTAGLPETDIYVICLWGEGTYGWQRFPAKEANPECRPGLNAIYIRHDLNYYLGGIRPRITRGNI